MSTYPKIYKPAKYFAATLEEGAKYYKCVDPCPPREFKAAGILTPTDVEDVVATDVMDEVLGLARPLYNLRNMCRIRPSDTLKFDAHVYGKLTAEEKVPPLVEADLSTRSREKVSFDLWKNVVHVAASDEALMQSAHDEMLLNKQDAAGALANSENSQIATIAEAGDNTSAGSDWGTITDGRSANNPFEDIKTAMATIRGSNGFPVDLVAAHPYVWMDFFGNDFVKGQLQGVVYPATSMFDLPGMPGMKGLSDWALTSTIALVLSTRNAIILGKGPTSSAKYRKETAGYDAYIIRDWLEPQIAQENAIYRLTAVHA